MCLNLRVRFGKLLSLFSAFSVALLVMQLFLQARPVRVSADTGDNSITLSYEQSLALFGTKIPCTYFDSSDNSTSIIDLVYLGTWESYVSTNYAADFYMYTPTSSSPTLPSNYTYRNYLVYGLSSVHSDSFELPVPWVSSIDHYDSYSHTTVSCSFPFPVESISSLQFSVLYSCVTAIDGVYSNVNNSSLSLIKTDGIQVFHPLAHPNYSSRFRGFLTPAYINPGSSYDNVPESNRIRMAYFKSDYTSDSNFGITGFQLGLNSLGSPELNSNMLGYNSLVPGYMPFIYVQCPTLTGYVPPVVTTTTGQTTNPYNYNTVPSGYTQQTVDLSNLESGVAAIVQQEQYNGDTLDWIGNNTMITANNLAYIANKLDQIYDLMVERGEIAVNLVPADPLRALDTNVHNQIHDSLDSFTTAQIPLDYSSDMQHSFSFVNTMYNKFTSGSLSFFGWVGILSLSMYVVIWFIFRGRG